MAATPATDAKHKGAPKYRARKDYSQAIVTLTDAVTGKRKDFGIGSALCWYMHQRHPEAGQRRR